MASLELKIPPLVVASVFALTIWLLARGLPTMGLPDLAILLLCPLLLLLGAGFSIAGVLGFRDAETTVNPMVPDEASSLVTGGIYRFSRNPMYVGFLCFLLAWALWLDSGYGLALSAAFVGYMNRFQIMPEERALEAHFGEAFATYRRRVRRWL